MKVCVVLLKWSNEKTLKDYTKVIGVFDESMFWKAEEIVHEILLGCDLDLLFPDGLDYITDIDVELVDFEVQSERRKA